MNWGIVGTGTVASQFAEAIGRVPGARLTAVASREPARAGAFARLYGAAATAASAAELAALAGVDVVYVATPHHRHEADALAAIAAGKAVLCEKPLAPDAAAAGRIAAAARARGVFCMEGLWSLCQPTYREGLARIGAGAIGAVRELMGSIAVPHAFDPADRFWDPAQGGGALLDRGIYLVALALALLDDPRPIFAASTRAPTGVDAATSFLLEDRQGRRAIFSVSLESYGANELVVQGSEGRCSFLEPVSNPPAFWIKGHTPMAAVPALTYAPVGLKARLKRQGLLRRVERSLMRGSRWAPGGLEHEIAEVERCMTARSLESPLVSLDRSIRALQILDAVAAMAAARTA